MARAAHLAQSGRRAFARLVLGQPNARWPGWTITAAPTNTTSPISFRPERQAVIVAEVNNVLPSRKGLFSSTHRFGGLYRDVELEATPDTRIDYAWVRGDFDQQTAEVHATVAYGDPACSLKKPVLRVTLKTSDGQAAGRGRSRTWSLIRSRKPPKSPAGCR